MLKEAIALALEMKWIVLIAFILLQVFLALATIHLNKSLELRLPRALLSYVLEFVDDFAVIEV